MSDRGRVRTRVPRAQREVQILDVASAVFAERGLHGTTMADIAEQVGITKPLIYDYFGSKELLLAAVVERLRLQMLKATSTGWFAVDEDAPVREHFASALRAFFEFMAPHSGAYVLLQAEGGLFGEAAATIERVRASQARVLANALSGVPGYDGLPTAHVHGIAEAVIGTCERISVWRESRADVTIDESVEIVMAVIWTGIGGTIEAAARAEDES